MLVLNTDQLEQIHYTLQYITPYIQQTTYYKKAPQWSLFSWLVTNVSSNWITAQCVTWLCDKGLIVRIMI